MKYIQRLKILLWFPYVILFFPLMIIFGKEKTESLAVFITEEI